MEYWPAPFSKVPTMLLLGPCVESVRAKMLNQTIDGLKLNADSLCEYLQLQLPILIDYIEEFSH